MNAGQTTKPHLFLGCPAWSIPEWRGNFFPERIAPREFLEHYARVFNTVEGNSLFYAVPNRGVVERWVEAVPESFRFCPKVPRDLSHERTLQLTGSAWQQFREALVVMHEGERLGPTFLQLPERFSPRQLAELQAFLEAWPKSWPLAVEVRHHGFYDEGEGEAALVQTLQEHGADRVVFDSRALYHAPPDDEVEAKSQTRKPRTPLRWEAVGKRPLLRFVGRNQIGKVEPWVEEVAGHVAAWLEAGLTPYVFMHAPDDRYAPQLAKRFHECLRKNVPGVDVLDLSLAGDAQLGLFG